MKPAKAAGWRPHEIAFAVFSSVTSARLFWCGTPGIFWGIVFAVLVFGIFAARNLPEKIRLWLYPPLMVAAYCFLGFAIPIFHPGATTLLARADRWLLGRDVSQFLEPWTNARLTDLFYSLYLFFFVYLGIALWDYSRRSPLVFQRFMAGLFTVYGIGLLGYTILPAGGPYLELAGDFSVPVEGSAITQTCESIVRWGSNRVDCFPCLHFAVSFFILVFDFWHCCRRFWWMLLPCAGIWIATIYIRQHYLVDLLGGLMVTLFSLLVVCPRQKLPGDN